jgi:hypothetical protein
MPSTRVLRGDTLLLLPAVTTTPRLTTTAAPTTTPRATTTAAPSTTPTTTPGANDMLLTTALFRLHMLGACVCVEQLLPRLTPSVLPQL